MSIFEATHMFRGPTQWYLYLREGPSYRTPRPCLGVVRHPGGVCEVFVLESASDTWVSTAPGWYRAIPARDTNEVLLRSIGEVSL